MDGFVYRWTNRVNGRWYVGSHAGVPSDGYVGSGKIFKLAVRKYGLQNFDRQILYQGAGYLEFETAILQELNAAASPLSYNMKNEALGGTSLGVTRSLLTRGKISRSRRERAERDGFLNSKVTRARIAAKLTGKILSEVTIAKIKQNSIEHGCKPPAGSHTTAHSRASRELISRNTRIGMFAKKQGISFQEAEILWQTKK
jgi:group I intron endonuclease